MSVKVTTNVMSFRIKPSTVDAEKRTVTVVWGTEKPVRRYDWWRDEEFDEVLGMTAEEGDITRLNNGAAVLDNHNWTGTVAKQQIGVVERAWFENGLGMAELRFSKKPEAEVVWQDIVDGIVRNISFMYDVKLYQDVTPAGGEMKVRRAVNYEVFEISIVTIPADPGAGVRSHAHNKKEQAYEVKVINQKQETEMGKEEVTNPAPAPAAQVDETAVKKAGAEAEKTRAKKIRAAVKSAKLEDEFAQELIDEDVTFEAASERIFKKLNEQTEKDSVRNIQVGHEHDKGEQARSAIVDALLARSNPEKHKPTEASRAWRGFSQIEIGRRLLELRGVRTEGLSKRELAKRILASSDFQAITASIAGRTLRSSYEAAAQTFWPFVNKGTLPDFRDVTRVSVGGFSDLKQVNEGDEYEEGIFGDGAEKYRVLKYGRLCLVTEEMIVNDDLDAILRLPKIMGASAGRKETAVVYGILTGNPKMADNVDLFHADHANLGGALAIGEAGLDDAYLKLGEQVIPDSEESMNLAPKYIVAGPKNRLALQKILTAVTAGKTADVNVFNSTQSGLVGIIDGSIKNKAWFAIGDKNQCDTIEVGYLEGEDGPTISENVEFKSDVISYKISHVFGAKAIDHKNMYKNPGA